MEVKDKGGKVKDKGGKVNDKGGKVNAKGGKVNDEGDWKMVVALAGNSATIQNCSSVGLRTSRPCPVARSSCMGTLVREWFHDG